MKLLTLPALGLLATLSIAGTPAQMDAFQKQVEKLQQIVAERAKILAGLSRELDSQSPAAPADDTDSAPAPVPAPAPPATQRPSGPVQGLQISSLRTGSLQPSAGVQSAARGLTPEQEWRRMFPHRPGYSR